MEPTALELLLMIGLTARAIRLAVVDTIATPFRDLARFVGEGVAGDRGLLWADDLVRCPFCIGFWIALAVAVAWTLAGHTLAYRVIAIAGTLSYLAGHAVARADLVASDD